MAEDSTNPYAPPSAEISPDDKTAYLAEDGYAFQNELVANKYFKPPLICAKLGIPIPAENFPVTQEITIKRVSTIPPFIASIVSFISVVAIFIFIFRVGSNLNLGIFIIYIFLAKALSLLFSRPYKISFYFSESYKSRRRMRNLLFGISYLILVSLIILGIFTNNHSYIVISIPAIILTSMIYKFKMTYFIVTQTKGEFHYIRGVHQNLLNALPHLPLS